MRFAYEEQCCAYLAASGCAMAWLLNLLQRRDMRSRYNLEGSTCTDGMCACCCAPCDLVQQSKEIAYRESQKATGQPGRVEPMTYPGSA